MSGKSSDNSSVHPDVLAPDNFRLLSLNARSLCNKLNSFLAFVHYYRPAVVAVTETWLRSDIPGIFVNGYTCFRNDRQNGMGGGTLLLVLNSLSPVLLSPKLSNNENFCDSTWCTLRHSNGVSLLVGCVYRSPSSTVENNQRLISVFEHMCNLPHLTSIKSSWVTSTTQE